MAVTLRKRKLPSGNTALFLDYYHDGKRIRELLRDYVLRHRDTQQNKETMKSAEVARTMLEHDLAAGKIGVIPEHRKRAPFLPWMESYVDKIRPSDYKMHNAVYRKFQDFVDNDEILASAITPALCQAFRRYLAENHSGETPYNYFRYFKRILKAAVEAGFFKSNPAVGIRNANPVRNEVRKQVLFPEEISKLAQTECGNPEVKRAFLFSTQTGLRLCDIVQLQWKHVILDPEHPRLEFGQKKVGQRKNVVPLNATAQRLLGTPGRSMDHIFQLGSTNGVNKVIKHWVKNAGIKKHITYHCARHSAGTNYLFYGADLKTTSQLMGHSSIAMTEKYLHITDERKRDAVNRLPDISGI